MTHLTPNQFYAIACDRATPDAAVAGHLAVCAACRADLEALAVLLHDLAVARRSQPSAQAMQRYLALYPQVQQQGSWLGNIWQTLVAVLTWDSRRQPALQGVRSGATVAYRLLYMTTRAELEIMVEPDQQRFRVQGEVIALDGAGMLTPALVELLDAAGVALATVETDDRGHFRLEGVASGIYRLLVTSPDGAAIKVEEMEIG